jgi:hypothetical protein
MDAHSKASMSRRSILKAAAVFAASAVIPAAARDAVAQGQASKTPTQYQDQPKGAAAGAAGGAAKGKASKAAVQYQDQPKGGQRCSGCVNFITGGQCKIVEGSISPNGWCTAYVAKS